MICNGLLRMRFTDDVIVAERKKFGADRAQSRLLVFTGRLLKRTKLSLLFEAIKELNDSGCDIRLVVVGDGNSRNEFTDKVEKSWHFREGTFLWRVLR